MSEKPQSEQLEPAPAKESALVFTCNGSQMVGILHHAENDERIGLVIVVGGPQTRVGSHRQFVQLARTLAKNDIPVLRFDYRGMGDSDGSERNFEHISGDIRAAIDEITKQCEIDRVVLWGLCDAAPAITSYAKTDERICGVVLLNPWVRTHAGVARAYMRGHYFKRILSLAFWARLVRGELNLVDSLGSFLNTVLSAIQVKKAEPTISNSGREGEILLPVRMMNDIDFFKGSILLVMSGNDITAQEFHNTVETSAPWRKLLKRGCVMRQEIVDADHTFSSRTWSQQVEAWTIEWVKML